MKYTHETITTCTLANKTIAMIGYGNQGRPQALNLRDSGINIVIGVRESGPSWHHALADGFTVQPIPTAVSNSNVIMLMLPDDQMQSAFATHIKPNLKPRHIIGLNHGLSLISNWLDIPTENSVFLAAAKGQGLGVRQKFIEGSGVPGLAAVHQDGNLGKETILNIALEYLKALGCGHTGITVTTAKEEAITNLFAEQTILCGGLSHLIKATFDTLVNRGYSEDIAYYECLHEVKLLADLIHDKGLVGMREAISPTARFGDISRGPRVIDSHVQHTLETVLNEIESGQFSAELKAEAAQNYPETKRVLNRDRHHRIEAAHQRYLASKKN